MPVMSGRMMGYITVVFPIIIYAIVKNYFKSTNKFFVFILLFISLGFFVLSARSTRLVLGLS